MACGSWDGTLKEDTPRSVRSRLGRFDTFCVTPVRMQDTLTRSLVMGSAIYSGRLLTRANGRRSLSGDGLLAWLGDGDGVGPIYDESGYVDQPGFDTFADLMTAMWAVPERVNGLTLGSGHSSPADVYDGSWADLVTARTFITAAAEGTGVEFRLLPDGTFDWEASGTGYLFEIPPTLCVSPSIVGVSRSGINVVRGDVDTVTDETDFASRAYCWSGDSPYYEGDATTIGTIPKTPLDHTDPAWITVVLNTDIETDIGNAFRAAELLLTENATHTTVDCSIDVDNPHRYVKPGDNVYFWDPDFGVKDTSNQIEVNGETIFPVELQVSEMTWEPRPPMGVYFIGNTDGVVTDVSDWWEFKPGMTRLAAGWRPWTYRRFTRRQGQ